MALSANDALNYSTPGAGALNGAFRNYQAEVDKQQQEIRPAVQKASSAIDQPHPAVPEQTPVTPAPKQEDFQHDGAMWMNAMAAFSALATATARQHATTGLKAFAAGVKGMREGQQQAFDDAYKTWEGSTKAALDNNKMVTDKYKAVLDDRELTVTEQEQKIKLIAAENHDQMVLEADRIDLQEAIYLSKVKAHDQAEATFAKLQEWKDKENFKQKEKAEPSIDQPTADFAADQLLAGDKSGLSNYGRGEKATANLALIHKTVQERAASKGITGDKLAKINAEFAGLTSEQRAIGTRAGSTAAGAGELDELIGPTKEALKKLDLSSFPDYNAFKNYASAHTGDPDISAAAAMLQETSNAYTALLVRGGQRTDAAQAASDHLVNLAMAPGQADAVLDVMEANSRRIMAGIEKARKGTVGQGTPTDAPAGVSSDLWKHMTPEEKALWQTPSQ